MKNHKFLISVVLLTMLAFSGVASAEKASSLKNLSGGTLKKAQAFDGSVQVKMVNKEADLQTGDTVVLKAMVKGGKKVDYKLRWEVGNGVEWKALDEETAKVLGCTIKGKTLSFELSPTNSVLQYRVAVVTK